MGVFDSNSYVEFLRAMTQPQLRALLKRVTSARGADREIDAEVALVCGYTFDDGMLVFKWTMPDGVISTSQPPAVTASLDAALDLVKRIDPNWCWRIEKSGPVGLAIGQGPFWATCGEPGSQESAHAATPALALIAALLKSLIDDQHPRRVREEGVRT
jgi:hypothetical protein